MRALIVQHEHDGPAGLVGEHLARRGHELVVHQVMRPGSTHSEEPFPDPTEFDVLVSLGSVHGVYERDRIGSWIDRELDVLRRAHDEEVPVLGICFGAQALTAALGGSVEPSPAPEIGWTRVEVVDGAPVAAGPWFTWHGDRCLLPDGVDELARTELCTQVFRAGRSVGVQFHPEVTRELVEGWVAKCSPEYFATRGVTAEELLAGFEANGEEAARHAVELVDWFLDDVAADGR